MMRWFWQLIGASYCDTLRRPHDYHKRNGGDGFPSHGFVYACWACGARFSI